MANSNTGEEGAESMSDTSSLEDLEDWHEDHFPDVLVKDVVLAQQQVGLSDSQYHRRVLIRSIFAGIEGILSIMKDDLIGVCRTRHPLSIAEYSVLEEVSFTSDDRGLSKTRPSFLPLTSKLRFMVRALNTRLGRELNVDFGSSGWQNLRSSLSVRHRLTHPKKREDLDVSEEEVRRAMSAFMWVLGTALRFRDGILEVSGGSRGPSEGTLQRTSDN